MKNSSITIGEVRGKIAVQIEDCKKRVLDLLGIPNAEKALAEAKAEYERTLAENNALRANIAESTKIVEEGMPTDIEGLRARIASATPEALGPWTEELAAALARLAVSKLELAATRSKLDENLKKATELAMGMVAAKGTIDVHAKIDSEILRLRGMLGPLSGEVSSKLGLRDLSPNKKLEAGPVTDAGTVFVGKAEIGARVGTEFTEWIGVMISPTGSVVDWVPLKSP